MRSTFGVKFLLVIFYFCSSSIANNAFGQHEVGLSTWLSQPKATITGEYQDALKFPNSQFWNPLGISYSYNLKSWRFKFLGSTQSGSYVIHFLPNSKRGGSTLQYHLESGIFRRIKFIKGLEIGGTFGLWLSNYYISLPLVYKKGEFIITDQKHNVSNYTLGVSLMQTFKISDKYNLNINLGYVHGFKINQSFDIGQIEDGRIISVGNLDIYGRELRLGVGVSKFLEF